MEYVDGVSIEKAPPSTFEQGLDVFIQVAQGLAHMHRVGYVHADMKPNNVVVDSTGRVKIIDLGQACTIGTVKERIQGTPDYIAPEQVHLRPITPKTDIYNLGATMYWSFTKRHIPTALPKENSLVGSLDDKFIDKPKPVRELNPRCPDILNDLIMACVQVDPEARPADMDEVVQRLQLQRAKLTAASATPPSLDDSTEMR
jgi:serine/threonine-protein kinase